MGFYVCETSWSVWDFASNRFVRLLGVLLVVKAALSTGWGGSGLARWNQDEYSSSSVAATGQTYCDFTDTLPSQVVTFLVLFIRVSPLLDPHMISLFPVSSGAREEGHMESWCSDLYSILHRHTLGKLPGLSPVALPPPPKIHCRNRVPSDWMYFNNRVY